MSKPELLAPAGDLEKLKIAILYGADAVYLGGESFGLRKASKNFSMDQIDEGVKFAHKYGKKVYVTMNIIPHNEDLNGIEEYILGLENIGIDGLIVADPGIFSIIRRTSPNLPIHLSTQASVTNYETIMFWYNLGIRRIVLARELSFEEIKEIVKRVPKDMEVETFVHGAMCISYSGRCLLSNYMAGRDANMGDCAQPCRWKYYLMEEKRPGEYFPISEEENGTFIYNSKDLCLIEYIPELIESGIKSFKIEGRVKSLYYVATIVRSYRRAIDAYYKGEYNPELAKVLLEEIKKVSHRDFTSGFYFNKPTGQDQLYTSSSYIRDYDYVGLVLEYDKANNIATVEQRNRMFVGDTIELFGPNKDHITRNIEEMWDESDNRIDVAPHPQQIVKIRLKGDIQPFDILRKSIKE